jgi:hypothetical protein
MLIPLKIVFLISLAVIISLFVTFGIGFIWGWAFDIGKRNYLDGWDDAGKAFTRDIAESKNRRLRVI